MSANIESDQATQTTSSSIDAFFSYPFEADENYQQGLASIFSAGTIDPSAPEAVKEQLILRTRIFYYNKIAGSSLTPDEIIAYRLAQDAQVDDSPAISVQDSAPETETGDTTRVLSFAELKELIESGRVDQIPNNKHIPDKLNEEVPSQSTATIRKKPWESTASEAVA